MDKKYFLSVKDVIQQDPADEKLMKYFNLHENNIKKDFRKMINTIKEYLDDIGDICDIKRGKNDYEFLQNIRIIFFQKQYWITYKN
ncbi:protein kinase domain protein [Ichthyophthirius multifiliis]|uniref:Protein kinase domain protein n=1 Tax=Ichthyophthirius multifiliis TaxID=5932 RepID=G0QRF8_ICHMU|nr:protein kinase domain protein [Ichthyophthirius multifiliis]EGR32193.1 protein kinase domain protein [Ichthyophthirius multifiliis]|eukprot:XP_004035679.1 protein kinase domain protein [Ichthyophthirius multifiliis]